MTICRVMTIVSCLFAPIAATTVTCPADYKPFVGWSGLESCKRAIWRDFALYPGADDHTEYVLPQVGSEGWDSNMWKMCLNGTLGPSVKTFSIRFLGLTDTLASVKAVYGKNKSKFILQYFEDGKKTTKEKVQPEPYPFSEGDQFGLTAQVFNQMLKYNFCGPDTCVTVNQSLTDTNLHEIKLKFQASISSLDLACS